MFEPTARRHLTIIELDQGYTVSMGERILACAGLQGVADAIYLLFGPENGAARATVASPFMSVAFPDNDEPEEEDADEEEEPAEEEEEDEEEETPPLEESIAQSTEHMNLRRIIAAYLEQRIDQDDLTNLLARYCPRTSPLEVQQVLMQAQGLDPARYVVDGVA